MSEHDTVAAVVEPATIESLIADLAALSLERKIACSSITACV